MARAIQNGEAESGVTVIRMTPKIDAGGILSIARTPIGPDETAGELEDRLAVLGAPFVADAIAALANGQVELLPQDRTKVTKAPKLRKDDGFIDWTKPAQAVHNLVRAMQPWPAAQTTWRPRQSATAAPARLIVLKTALADGNGSPGQVLESDLGRLIVAAGEGAVELVQVQVPGKKPVSARDFLHGYRLSPGDRIGD